MVDQRGSDVALDMVPALPKIDKGVVSGLEDYLAQPIRVEAPLFPLKHTPDNPGHWFVQDPAQFRDIPLDAPVGIKC